MKNIFTTHPNSIGESYYQHFKFALWLGVTLIKAGCAVIIHALLPFLFVETAGRNICLIVEKLRETNRWELLQKKYGCKTSNE